MQDYRLEDYATVVAFALDRNVSYLIIYEPMLKCHKTL